MLNGEKNLNMIISLTFDFRIPSMEDVPWYLGKVL